MRYSLDFPALLKIIVQITIMTRYICRYLHLKTKQFYCNVYNCRWYNLKIIIYIRWNEKSMDIECWIKYHFIKCFGHNFDALFYSPQPMIIFCKLYNWLLVSSALWLSLIHVIVIFIKNKSEWHFHILQYDVSYHNQK